ncbi:hypothetical protein BDV19DRAFT_390633 [Aspergillus venezuelensis]
MVDFTRPTKPNTRIPPILLARKHQNQNQPSISTSPPQPEQATHIINLSQRKLFAESNNADPSLRRCLAHHRLLTKSIFEAKSDMKVYFDEVEYESDSEDEEDEDAVFDEHVEVVGMFHRDNDNVRVVDEESDAEAMLFHEEPMVHQEEVILSRPDTHPSGLLTPPPGLPVPSNMAVTMPMSMSMSVSAYTPTSTASTLTHQPRSKISRPSFSSKIDSDHSVPRIDNNATHEHPANPEPPASGVSADVTPSSTSPFTSTSTTRVLDSENTKEDETVADTTTLPPRPPLSSLPTLTSTGRTTSSAPKDVHSTSPSSQKGAHPIKDKFVSTVKGLVKRRNSSPSCLPMSLGEDTQFPPSHPVFSKDQHTEIAEPTKSSGQGEAARAEDEVSEKETTAPHQHLSPKNASCSSIPARIKVHEDIARNCDTGPAIKRSSSFASQNTQRQSHAQMQGERVGVAVPVTT